MTSYLIILYLSATLSLLCSIGLKLEKIYKLEFVLITATSLAAGFRENVGADYNSYANIFTIGQHSRITELIFYSFSEFIFATAYPVIFGFTIMALITNFCYGYFFIKLVPKYFFIAWTFYLAIPIFYINSLNLSRQHLAASICLASLAATYSHRKKLSYFIGLSTAVLIHNATVGMILLASPAQLFLRYRKFLLLTLPFLIYTTVSIERNVLENTMYEYFLEWNSNNSVALAILLFFMQIITLFIPWRRNIFKLHSRSIYILNIASFYMAIFMGVWLFSLASNFWLRAAMFFSIPTILTFILAPLNIKSLLVHRILHILMVILAVMLGTYYWVDDSSFGYVAKY